MALGTSAACRTAFYELIVRASLVLCALSAAQGSAGFSVPPVLPNCDIAFEQHCIEVASATELHDALSDSSVREVVLTVPEIVLEEPLFSSDQPVLVARDVLIRGSKPGTWPVLSNKLGLLPTDSAIVLKASVMFLRLRLEGWMALSETAGLKNDDVEDSIMSSPGVDIQARDPRAGPMREDFVGVWMAPLYNRYAMVNQSLQQQPGYFSGFLVQECVLDIRRSNLLESLVRRYPSPWYGLIETFKEFRMTWFTEDADVAEQGIMEWPLRSIFYTDRALVPLWSWADVMMFNCTLYWDLPSEEDYKPLSEDCSTSGRDICRIPSHSDCQTPGWESRGMDYQGDLSVAGILPDSASDCIPWKDVHLLGADFSSLEGNSCRNPGTTHATAFCFKEFKVPLLNLSFPNLELCDIPSCVSESGLMPNDHCQHKEDQGQSYNGTVAVSESGKPCLNWTDVQYAQYTIADRNYCRNLDGMKDRVWCYTDYGYVWEYCDIQNCQETWMNAHLDVLDGLQDSSANSQPQTPPAPSGQPRAPIPSNSVSPASSKQTMVIGISMAGAVLVTGAVLAYYLLQLRRGRVNASPEVGIGNDSDTLSNNNSRSGTNSTGAQLVKISYLAQDPVELGLIQLEEAIGTGYTAQVWRSRWMGVEVACKILRMDYLSSGHVRSKVLQGMEASLVSELSHPNVIRTFQIYRVSRSSLSTSSHVELVGTGDDKFHEESDNTSLSANIKSADEIWILQEYCKGGDLTKAAIKDKRFHKSGELDIVAVLTILRQIAMALNYLHTAGIVHGDLKCANVLVDTIDGPMENATIKVTDFGLAHALPAGAESSYTSSNLIGDYMYMSPEALLDNKVSAKMDTYSFGLVAYELITGESVSAAATSARHASMLVAGERPSNFPSSTDPLLRELVQSCWVTDPDSRPSDDEVIRRLEEMMEAHRLQLQASANSDNSLPGHYGTMIGNLQIQNPSLSRNGYVCLSVGDDVASSNSTSISLQNEFASQASSSSHDGYVVIP